MRWRRIDRNVVDIAPIIARNRQLLDGDKDASVACAALEARLALEKTCYDRLFPEAAEKRTVA